jgi:hypothetical protein
MGTGRFTHEQIQKAIQAVREKNAATITMIMRELNVGYTDATGIVRETEKRGVVSTPATTHFARLACAHYGCYPIRVKQCTQMINDACPVVADFCSRGL